MSTGTLLVEPLKLHTSDTEGIGLRWSPQMARLMSAVPPLRVEQREKRAAYVHDWMRNRHLVERLAAVPSVGGARTSAAEVIAALIAFDDGADWHEVAASLGHTETWLHRRQRHILTIVARWYDRGEQ